MSPSPRFHDDVSAAGDRYITRLAGLTAVAVVSLALAACKSTGPPLDDPVRMKMLALLMPARIEIVEPFTRAKSFDKDAIPDGIELLLQAVNALDNPGLMIAGTLTVDLYEYIPASGDKLGRHLEHWDIELTTAQQQRAHWNGLTRMYEVRLALNPEKIAPADKFVLVATYHSPLGERLADEFVIRYKPPTAALTGRPTSQP
ncbi:MAG: hypothetical protein ACE5EX_00405 [Phycisphaerae bacterium]